VTPWTDDDRRELAELCRAHDEMMTSAATHTQSDDPADLIFKTTEDATPAAADAAEPYPPFGDLMSGIAQGVVALLQGERVKYARRIDNLEGEIREIKGMLGAVLTMLGQNKSADVIDLPDWRKHNAA
jgi:hypothetical protein